MVVGEQHALEVGSAFQSIRWSYVPKSGLSYVDDSNFVRGESKMESNFGARAIPMPIISMDKNTIERTLRC